MKSMLALLLAALTRAAVLSGRQSGTNFKSSPVYNRDREADHFVPIKTVYASMKLRGSILDDTSVRGSLERSTTSAPSLVEMIGSEGLIAYVTEVTLGDSSTFDMVIDTGSSDTWVISEKFDCFDLDMIPQETALCRLGKGYRPSPSFSLIEDTHFATQYGDGERLTGIVGNEKVKVGSLTVPQQRINVVDRAAWRGDARTSGLLGLGYPANTANFKGKNATDESHPLYYDPFFSTAMKAGLVPEGTFSIALDRNINTTGQGFLSFGGLPPVRTFGRSVSVKITPHVRPSQGQTDYIVPIDGFKFPTSDSHQSQSQSQSQANALIDTGTSLLLVPAHIASAYNALWEPNHQEPPPFSILINGTEFMIDARDLKIATKTGFMSTVLPAKSTILGGTFMRNVVSTFDIAKGQMRFASTNPMTGAEQQ